MRFPWLQVDSDFISSKASDLGALLGISRREALGLALDLWTWCLSRSPPDRSPDGIVAGSAPVPMLASAVSWPDPERLVSALVEVGLAERVPTGLRLRGFGRYRATWEKNRRRPKAGPDRNRTGTATESPPEAARKTQTYTQKEKKEASSAPADAVSADVDDLPDDTEHAQPVARPPLTLFPDKPTEKPKRPPKPLAEHRGDPRHAPLVDVLVKADAELTGRPYGFRGGRDAKAVAECLALADQDPATREEAAPAEVLRRWRIGRRWQGFPACTSLTDLAANWNAYAQPQASSAPPGNSRAPVRAESQPQYDPSKPAFVVTNRL